VAQQTRKPEILFLSSTEGLPVLTELATLVTNLPSPDTWAIPHLWNSNLFTPGASFLASLLSKTKRVDFEVILLAPDDQLISRTMPFSAPRDNVLVEAGLCIGRLDPEYAVLVVESHTTPAGETITPKLPTDLDGLVRVDFSLPAGYSNFPSERRIAEIRTALEPVKQYLRTHFQSATKPPPGRSALAVVQSRTNDRFIQPPGGL
jgi:predicted nucleotide-binding protein